MKYSPKLKKAMSQIAKILSDNDIAGLVVLHDVGFPEYLLKIDPSYSVARVDIVNQQFAFRAKLDEDFDGDAKKMKAALAGTSNMLNLLSTTAGNIVVDLIDTSQMFDSIFGATHSPGEHTTQQEIDN